MNFTPTIHKLSNGIPVLLDTMDIQTASVKILVKGGARIEQPHEFGITHFIEHMLFNANEKFATSKDRRDWLNDHGGTVGAFTSISCTSYHGRILSENLPVLLEVLSSMLSSPKMLTADIAKEREIITQEINRSRDNQSRQFDDVVKRNLLSGSYFSRYDSMGSPETIGSFDTARLLDYKKEKYAAENFIIGISGNFGELAPIMGLLEKLFGKIPSGSAAAEPDPGKITPSFVYDVRADKKQTKIFVGFQEQYENRREFRFQNMCVSNFEGAMGRRLFEEAVDKKGLAYDLGMTSYGDERLMENGIFIALSPERLQEAIATLAKTCRNFAITEEELARRKIMAKLSRADFYESASHRCSKLLNHYCDYAELYNPAEYDAMRERMTTDDVMENNKNYFAKNFSIIAQGPECPLDLRKIWEESF